MKLKKILLSPPFSNFYHDDRCTRVLGTYTKHKRPGMWRNISTLRKSHNGWINKVGLRNPGIDNLYFVEDSIVSISLLEKKDWEKIFIKLKEKNVKGIELNISCPNKKTSDINQRIADDMLNNFNIVSIKLSHDNTMWYGKKYYDMGFSLFHISNTKPTAKGSLSGPSLVEKNLVNIEYLKQIFCNNIEVIGGGGIYDLDTALQYKNAGADYFSLSTVLINPLRGNKLIREIHEKL
tara:strand:- start:1375 stop:2082 length:708 start_codon:yes stop_codon:yes gene_type:complete